MKYKRFEELPVWQAAMEFALKIFAFSERHEKLFRGLGDTKNQIERSSLSISNNIAEGFERGTTSELIHFLYISKGSAGETRSLLCLSERVARFQEFREDIAKLKSFSENISRQLHGWLDALKNSEIKGQKFLTEKERESYLRKKEQDEYQEELRNSKRNLEARLARELDERNAARSAPPD